MSSAPVVFRYLDYRSFLRDHYAHRKAIGGLSHRSFARKAGFSSPNFLKLVMDGGRNLGPSSVDGVARACRLDSKASRYLRELVTLRRTKSLSDRVDVLGRIMAYDERVELFPLEQSATEYFGRWWVPVVRELSFTDAFERDPTWVAQCFGGRINDDQARRALDALQRLGLLHGQEPEALQSVSSGDELQTSTMQRYHQQLLKVAADTIETVDPERRDVSAITITGDAETFEEAKRMVQRFRKELLGLERRARSRRQVFQFCLQLFPIATTPDAGDGESRDD